MADADKVFIKGLVLNLSVGIYEHEKKAPQRVIVNACLNVESNSGKLLNSIEDVVSYEKAVHIIHEVSVRKHYDLLEELAEDIVKNLCFNNKIESITISLEKPDIFDGVDGVGVEISRVFTT